MFSKESRKKNMKDLINYIEKYMYDNIYPNNIVNGFLVLIFHWFIVGCTMVYIIFEKVDFCFYLCFLIWIIIFILHFYFHGCILTKIEKHLWKAKDWCGPWSLPFKLLEHNNFTITPELMNIIFITWGILVICFTMYKILYFS